MASEKNIIMRQYNGVDYDTLYPKTKVEQVEGAYTQQQILADSTKGLYGLGADAVPDDALRAIKSLINKANADINKRAQIMTGSYVGTSTQENSLTFNFVPKIVFIFSLEDFAILPCLLYGSTEISGSYYYATSSQSDHVGSNSIYEAKLVNKTLTLRASSTKPTYWYRYIMNDSEYTYHYIAIG